MIKLYSNRINQDFEKAQGYFNHLNTLDFLEISSIQLGKFQSIWEDCISDVPYYRELVEQGKAPAKISSWEDFYAIPVLDRITVQNNPEKFHRLSTSPDSYISTTGSTGQPVQLGIWKSESNILRIAKLVPWIQLGYTANSSLYLIWGHAHLLGTGWHRYWNHSVRKLKDWFLNYYRVDAYTLDKIKAKQIAQDIIRRKPSGLIGYAAILDLLCLYTQEYHDELRRVGLKFVMSCAEPPPREDTFELIRTVFNCPILQEFGGVDFGHVGFKIDDHPYTLFPDLNILEAELGNENNDTCSALVTTLYRRYVPLIRYQPGDLLTEVVHNQHGFITSFQEQIGRINDMILLSDGTSLHSVALLHCFKEEKSIFNVQLILADNGNEFCLIVQNPLKSEVETNIRKKLEQLHPILKNIPFKYVTDLSTNRAGKRRWIVDKRKLTSNNQLTI
jgi:phenylacetate-coenzyme A ligase PaaK-like adenylate-forming protein